MADFVLHASIGSYPHTQALKSGVVTVPSVRLEFEDVPMIQLFRRVCRGLEFALTEMTTVTYFAMRERGLPYTALPVFLTSAVDGGENIFVNESVRAPSDLTGKSIGVRSYTYTPGVWKRAYLAEHGLDPASVTWVLNDEEHILALHDELPSNIERRIGADLRQMLAAGEIEGAIGFGGDIPGIRPLFPSARVDAAERFAADGVHNVIHTVIVRDELLATHPKLGRALYEAFVASKTDWLRSRPPGSVLTPVEDPAPVGFTHQRPSIERLMEHAVEQGVLVRPIAVEALFLTLD